MSSTREKWGRLLFPLAIVASYKCPGIRLSFEYTTTLLSGEGGEGRTCIATMLRKMSPSIQFSQQLLVLQQNCEDAGF